MTEAPNDIRRRPVYAVDFDDTLAVWDCGEPLEDEIGAIWDLVDEGWCILVHTARTSSQWGEPERTQKVREMLEWLIAHNVPFDGVWGLDIAWQEGVPASNELPEGWEWIALDGRDPCDWLGWRYNGDSGKPVADMYRDDRADGRCTCHVDAWLRGRVGSRIVERARQLAGIATETEAR
jgi:hypothetical protein